MRREAVTDRFHAFDETIVSCCGALFSGLEPHDRAPPHDYEICASIPFLSAGFHGNVVLMTTREFARRSLPAGVLTGAKDEDVILADWMCEAANQLVGRVKNRLLRVGMVLEIGLASVSGGAGISHYGHGPASGRHSERSFVLGDQPLQLIWETVVLNPAEVQRDDRIEEAPLSEGEVSLF
jgi:hypothetical protein